ncbi:MAG TPA: DUF370 domain-containing protein [Candidatus Limivivens merdigallinarum]|uniref:Putative regulatory protein IAB26_02300 n=1 Tax=Candidatus Limivivens merdigallinarum TaxID=2840859 RepID=A0A9D0ZV30_9FIRM|nr:DUF370 domain-containing protein [Candidatus Limivivens merdigallinarum]
MTEFINIGFGNLINAGKIVAVVCPEAAPVKRLVQKAKESGRVIDATQGRKTKAVIVTEEDHVILSALQPETISRRFLAGREAAWKGEEDE